ncbi:MAG: hypothetical protein AAF682_14910 [Planctomycetota bacterium]
MKLLIQSLALGSACLAAASVAAGQIDAIQAVEQTTPELERGAGVGGAVPPAAGEQRTARQAARAALDEMGLAAGYDPVHDRFVTVGASNIPADPSHPSFGSLRSVAFREAVLDASRKLVDYLGVAVQTRVERVLSTPTSISLGVVSEAGTQLDEVSSLVQQEAERLLAERQGLSVGEAVREVLARAEFQDAIQVAAAAEAAGMQVLQSFESLPAGSPGAVAVIGMVSPGSRAMAAALLGQGEVPAGAPKFAVDAWVRALPAETLLYTHGVLQRRDENGELTLVAFGQATPEAHVGLLVDAAYEEARLDALQSLREFVGFAVVQSASRERAVDLEAYRSGAERVRQQFRSTKDLQSSIRGVAASVQLLGVTDLHEWSTVHPLAAAAGSETPTVGVVLAWKPSSALNAAALREAGAEPADDAQPEAPAPRPGGGGSGARGDIED